MKLTIKVMVLYKFWQMLQLILHKTINMYQLDINDELDRELTVY